MKEKIENLKETVRIIAKNTMIYGIIIISVIASFIVGYTYHKLNSKVPDEKEVIKVRKSDVTIAIDEHHRLIVINLYAHIHKKRLPYLFHINWPG